MVTTFKVAVIDQDETLEELTARNAHVFLTAQQYTLPVYDLVREEFEAALKAKAPIDRRKKTQEKKIMSGDVEFTLKTNRSERTAYQAAGQALQVFLADLATAYDAGKRPQGILTINDAPYIKASDVQEKILRTERENTGFTFTTTIEYDEEDAVTISDDQTLALRPGEYHDLTTENARDYIAVRSQQSIVKKNVIDAFKDAVKTRTGYSRDNVPEKTVVALYEVGDTICSVVVSPRDDIKYKNAFEDFARMVAGSIQAADKTTVEDVAVRNGEAYISLRGLIKTYEQLLDRYKGKTVQQDVSIIPTPRWDHVVAE